MRYLVRRLAFSALAILGAAVVVFLAIHMVPGDPAVAMLGKYATQEEIEAYRHQLGLDRPLIVQLGVMFKNYAAGDLGTSISTHRPVADEIVARLPYTVALAVAGMFISAVAGVTLGVTAARWRNRWLDLVILNLSTVGMAIPSFVLALFVSVVFSVKLGWFPTIGGGTPGDWLSQLHALVLPSCALGMAGMAFIARMTRSAMLDVLREDYIRTARAKGLSERVVLFRHALKNAAIPTITVIGFYFGIFVGGGVILETIFARPGLGRLLVNAMLTQDYPVIQGVMLFIVVSFVIVNLLTDLVYSVLDPRVRQG